jgi:hypothetical protein
MFTLHCSLLKTKAAHSCNFNELREIPGKKTGCAYFIRNGLPSGSVICIVAKNRPPIPGPDRSFRAESKSLIPGRRQQGRSGNRKSTAFSR